MARRPSFGFLPLLVATAVAGEAGRGGGGGLRRRFHDDHEESVSSEPMTREYVTPEQPDRDRLLETLAGDRGGWEVMDGLDLMDGEEPPLDDVLFDDLVMTDDVGADFNYTDDFAMYDWDLAVDDVYAAEEWEPLVKGSDSEEGSEEVGEVAEAYEPTSRKLRRPGRLSAEEESEGRLAEKMSYRDASIPIFEPALDENGEYDLTPYAEPDYRRELFGEGDSSGNDRNLQSSGCNANQMRVMIMITTDNAGWETSWNLKKSDGTLISKGPPPNTNYDSGRTYMGAMCLNSGQYAFTILDSWNDGMCGALTGEGSYKVYIGGQAKFTSPSNCENKWGRRTHTFTINSPDDNSSTSPVSGRGGCVDVKIQFKIDQYGRETSVTLTGNGQTHLSSIKEVGAHETKTLQKCVPPGTYELKLQDPDGICCNYGQGYYKLWADNVLLINGGFFIGSKSHTVRVGYNWEAQMSSRDRQWLDGHNSRRQEYNGGRGYVPLRWSTELASDAKAYAQKVGCGDLVHEKGVEDGENLAKNWGPPAGGGALLDTDKVMRRWVENELTWAYPKNAHYTQVVWRSTQYVGCGESAVEDGRGNLCRVQVCRYARPGNCSVRDGNWKAEAWKDETPCGRPCPESGCYA